jgi:hypothetical protein
MDTVEQDNTFNWPATCNRDRVAKEIDGLTLPVGQRLVLGAIFAELWTADQPPDWRPGWRMIPIKLPALARKLGLHINTVRPALRLLEESGWIETKDWKEAKGPPTEGNYVGIPWGRFYSVRGTDPTPGSNVGLQFQLEAYNSTEPLTDAVGQPIVGLQSQTVGLQIPIAGLQSTLEEVLRVMQHQREIILQQALVLQEIRGYLADRSSQPESPEAGSDPCDLKSYNGVCSPTDCSPTDCSPTDCSPTDPLMNHEIMNVSKDTIMNHESHEANVGLQIGGLQTVALQSTKTAVESPTGFAAFPDPYYRPSRLQLENDRELNYLFTWCAARRYWPGGAYGRREFYAAAEYSCGARCPGSAFRARVAEGAHGDKQRADQCAYDRADERLRLQATEVTAPTPPPKSPKPIDTETVSWEPVIRALSDEQCKKLLHEFPMVKGIFIEMRVKGENPFDDVTVFNQLRKRLIKIQKDSKKQG